MAITEPMDEGPFEEYFKEGTLKSKGSRKSGSYDGPFEEYYSNGQLKEKCCYTKGLINGPYVDYFKSGQLSFKYGYKLIPELEKPDYSIHSSQFFYKFFYPILDNIFLIDLIAKCLILGRSYLKSPWFFIDFISTLPIISSAFELVGSLGPQLQATRVARAARVDRNATARNLPDRPVVATAHASQRPAHRRS